MCIVSTLTWSVAEQARLTGLLVDSIFLFSRFRCNRVGTLMISDKGTKHELSPESTLPEIPAFSSLVPKLLEVEVTWPFLSACRTKEMITNSLLNIYPQDKMKEIFEPDTLYPSIDLHNGDVLTYSYRNHWFKYLINTKSLWLQFLLAHGTIITARINMNTSENWETLLNICLRGRDLGYFRHRKIKEYKLSAESTLPEIPAFPLLLELLLGAVLWLSPSAWRIALILKMFEYITTRNRMKTRTWFCVSFTFNKFTHGTKAYEKDCYLWKFSE